MTESENAANDKTGRCETCGRFYSDPSPATFVLELQEALGHPQALQAGKVRETWHALLQEVGTIARVRDGVIDIMARFEEVAEAFGNLPDPHDR